MTSPRNDPPAAGWSDRFRVGDRLRGGSLTGGVRDGGVWVNASLLGTGVMVEISAAEAELFAAWLVEWARQARAANWRG